MSEFEYNDIRIQIGKPVLLLGVLCWITILATTLFETDAYRYATLILAVIGCSFYIQKLRMVKPDWMAWACFAWATYALLRFLSMYLHGGVLERGASEWLYVFPFFFPLLGLAMVFYKPYLASIVAAFFVLALICLLVTTDYGPIVAGEAISPLIHHNRIHGAVGCGLIVITAFFWLMHSAAQGFRSLRLARLASCVAPLVIVLALLNIYGSKSKGVWLAMAIAIPLMFIFAQTYLRNYRLRLVGVLVLVALAGCLLLIEDNLAATAGPTVTAIVSGAENIWNGTSVGSTMTDQIASGDIPLSLNERLQLWHNAWQVISVAPLFGSGNHWLQLWKSTDYAVNYTLMHNGYLEIAVRHGIFGLLVFAVILVGFLRTAAKACKTGVISRQALHGYYTCIAFFCITLLSNSNNRLAMGEMFVLVAGAVAFYCHIEMQLLRRGMTLRYNAVTGNADLPLPQFEADRPRST